MPVITDEFREANHGEAGLWILIGLIALFIAVRRPGYARRRCLILSPTLIVFGFSDIVEATTGAWWRPWWLFVWKAVCVIILVALLVEHYWRQFQARRRAGNPATAVLPSESH
jgi:hypothetical protein